MARDSTNDDAGSASFQDPLVCVLGYVTFRNQILRGELFEFTCLVGTMVQETYGSNPRIRDHLFLMDTWYCLFGWSKKNFQPVDNWLSLRTPTGEYEFGELAQIVIPCDRAPDRRASEHSIVLL